ncbi:MAG TPA: hypothetical protein VNM16_09530 [Bacillota bacterium]|nr:hypothetical protein [Bacillota bacterium]
MNAHGVTDEEVEEAVFDDDRNVTRQVVRNGEVRYNVFGRTQAGRSWCQRGTV